MSLVLTIAVPSVFSASVLRESMRSGHQIPQPRGALCLTQGPDAEGGNQPARIDRREGDVAARAPSTSWTNRRGRSMDVSRSISASHLVLSVSSGCVGSVVTRPPRVTPMRGSCPPSAPHAMPLVSAGVPTRQPAENSSTCVRSSRSKASLAASCSRLVNTASVRRRSINCMINASFLFGSSVRVM